MTPDQGDSPRRRTDEYESNQPRQPGDHSGGQWQQQSSQRGGQRGQQERSGWQEQSGWQKQPIGGSQGGHATGGSRQQGRAQPTGQQMGQTGGYAGQHSGKGGGGRMGYQPEQQYTPQAGGRAGHGGGRQGRGPQGGQPPGGPSQQRPQQGSFQQGTAQSYGGEAGGGMRSQQPGQFPGGGRRRARQPAGLLESMSVGEVARAEVYAVDPETRVSTIVEEMRDLNVGCAVITEDDSPIGVLTDRSIALQLAETPDVVERTARQLVDGGEVATATVGSDVFEVLDTMSDRGVRRIPIVDEADRLEGIVSMDDVLVLLSDKLGMVAETVRDQYPDL